MWRLNTCYWAGNGSRKKSKVKLSEIKKKTVKLKTSTLRQIKVKAKHTKTY